MKDIFDELTEELNGYDSKQEETTESEIDYGGIKLFTLEMAQKMAKDISDSQKSKHEALKRDLRKISVGLIERKISEETKSEDLTRELFNLKNGAIDKINTLFSKTKESENRFYQLQNELKNELGKLDSISREEIKKSTTSLKTSLTSEIQKIKEELKKLNEIEKVEEYAELKEVEYLKGQIEELKKNFDESQRKTAFALASRGGSGVIGIPPPEGNPEGYVLTVNETKAKWKQSTGGGLAAGTFTINNNTPNYTFDATTSTIDTLYQTVATLIRKLQGEI
jgi:hypothetical protein